MIFWLAGHIGGMFSGFLQAAAYKNLGGVHGYAGCKLTPISGSYMTAEGFSSNISNRALAFHH